MEPPLEEGEAHANFLDEAFGENTQVEHYLDQAYLNMRSQENRMTSKSLQAKAKAISKTTQPEFKKKVLDRRHARLQKTLGAFIEAWHELQDIDSTDQMLSDIRTDLVDKLGSKERENITPAEETST